MARSCSRTAASPRLTGEYIHYSEETAHLYEQAEGYVAATVGQLALAPVYKKGWKTYNFEVEGLHTYIAGGVRVHNASVFIATGKELHIHATSGITPDSTDKLLGRLGSKAYGGNYAARLGEAA